MLAALEGHEAIVKFLINQEANGNYMNVSGRFFISFSTNQNKKWAIK